MTTAASTAMTVTPDGSGGLSVAYTPAPPSQAAAAGFTTLAFNSDFTSASEVATSSGQTTGANLYWASGCSPSVTVNTSAGTGATADAFGVLTINGWTGTSFGPNLSTVPPNATSSTTVGVWNHGYFESRMQFGATVAGSGAPGGIQEPGFWLKDARNLTSAGSGSYHFAETDIMEYYPNGTAGSSGKYISTLHNWFDNASTYTDQFNNNSTNYDSSHQPTDGLWHTYGMLWTGNGTTGQVSFYFDDILCTHSGVQYYALDITGSPTAVFTAMENAKMFLNLTAASSGWPVSFDWIRVWQ